MPHTQEAAGWTDRLLAAGLALLPLQIDYSPSYLGFKLSARKPHRRSNSRVTERACTAIDIMGKVRAGPDSALTMAYKILWCLSGNILTVVSPSSLVNDGGKNVYSGAPLRRALYADGH